MNYGFCITTKLPEIQDGTSVYYSHVERWSRGLQIDGETV